MKKMLVVLLSVLMALLASCAGAEETDEPTVYTSGDWEYVLLEDGTAEIVGYEQEMLIPSPLTPTPTAPGSEITESTGYVNYADEASYSSALVMLLVNLTDTVADHMLIIPATIDGYTVTAIGDGAFSYCSSLTSITIPDSVTVIGDEAFYLCSSLTSITIPDSVMAIGDFAFFSCDSLTSITIPDSVTAIGTNPFFGCAKLTDIIVSPDHPTLATIDGVLFDKVEKTLICYPYAYTNSSYAIPQGIRVIGDHAFVGCESLTSITIPDSVTAIGNFAFAGCESLTSITIPDSVTAIGTNPFSSCVELTDIIVSPDHPTLATIDGVLFDKVEKTLICYPYAYTNSSYAIPQGIRVIGDDAFSGCYSLTSITIPDSVTAIGDYAFSGCYSLTSITIPDSVTAIGDHAFVGCESLTSITIPDSVMAIGDFAFFYCESLTSITIPDSVTVIGDDAFFACDSLTSITVSRGSYAEEWALANGYTCTYMKPTGLSHGDLTYRIQTDGTAVIIGCTTEAAALEVPAAIEGAPVTAIGAYAFENCTTLTAMTLPDSVNAIADTAFEGCGRIIFTVPRNSYAAQWCKDNNLRYTYPDANDWLLD